MMGRFASSIRRCSGVWLLACLVAFLAVLCPGAAFASSPEVIASAPADGAQALPCEGRMWVQFENNVSSAGGNAELVTLETADGGEVSPELYTVSLPDAEVEFGFRQYIWVDVRGLEPDAGYVIHVKPGITAKNGAVSDSDTRIAFTTAAAGQEAVALANPEQVEGGSGNGDGSGGGKGGSDGGAASADVGAVRESEGVESGREPEVVYVDAQGRPVEDGPVEHEPVPAGELVLFGVCAAAVAAGLVLAVRRSRANVIK